MYFKPADVMSEDYEMTYEYSYFRHFKRHWAKIQASVGDQLNM